MTEFICRKCQSNLVQIGKKYVCSNEKCDYQELAASKNWYEETANDPSVWNENIIKKAPSIIAYEYKKLKKLFSSGSTYGVQLQIKDLFEVILKFPARSQFIFHVILVTFQAACGFLSFFYAIAFLYTGENGYNFPCTLA